MIVVSRVGETGENFIQMFSSIDVVKNLYPVFGAYSDQYWQLELPHGLKIPEIEGTTFKHIEPRHCL